MGEKVGLTGRVVVCVRPLLEDEVEDIFGDPPMPYETHVAIVFDNGMQVIASQDSEGNGPGTFFLFHEGEMSRLTEPEGAQVLPMPASET